MRALCFAIFVATLAGCSSNDTDTNATACDPVALAKQAAGDGVRDCGHAAVGADPKPRGSAL